MISSRSISSSSSCCLSSSRRIIGMQGYVHTRHWCSLWIFMMHTCFWVLNKPVFFCGVCHGMSTNNLPTCFWEFHQPRSLKLKQSQSVMGRSSNQWNIGWKTVGSWRKYGNFTQMIRPTYPSSSNSPSCALDCWCWMFERYGPGSSTVLTRRIWLTQWL